MSLATFLKDADPDTAAAIAALAHAAVEIAGLIRRNGLGGDDLGAATGGANTDGDAQKALDVRAEEIIAGHLAGAGGTAMLLSEEKDTPIPLDAKGGVIVAIDPLDGSSNINVNVSVGTIFSILPVAGGILQPGRNQIAAGFFTYGPQTTLIAALADGATRAFILDPDSGDFIMQEQPVRIPQESKEFAINAAYANHWFPPVATWFTHVTAGKGGAYGKDYRMRWVGSLVADAYRIFRRGGVFLYPGDSREGYGRGRLRLVYEAAPMAFLAERAGGSATDGLRDILAITPDALHARVPLIFGSAGEVARLAELHKTHE